jgi:hypothetical protein
VSKKGGYAYPHALNYTRGAGEVADARVEVGDRAVEMGGGTLEVADTGSQRGVDGGLGGAEGHC